MALIFLPVELLEVIIKHTMPEGFESTAMTCKFFYSICVRFIKEHNALHSQFHHFAYYVDTIGIAFDLITRIADKPRIADYIRSADFKIDGLSSYALCREAAKASHGSDAVKKLFADSPYFEEAGLDWQTYYAKIEEDLQRARYSQHAAAFLLTLLPNIETFCLPKKWKPNRATNKLINVVVRKAKQLYRPHNSLSLARVRKLELATSLEPQDHCKLNRVSAFLGLPLIQSFRGRSCVAMDDTAFKCPYNDFTTNLQMMYFAACFIDERSIAKFLEHSPSLKTLRYSHAIKENIAVRAWYLGRFVTAIEDQAGSRLEGLSVFIPEYEPSVIPERVVMSGFQRLQKLELSLDIALYARIAMKNKRLFIDDLIPASVSQLSFISAGSYDHAKILNVLFRDFADRKNEKFILPALEKIFLTFSVIAREVYRKKCASFRKETEKAGVALELISWPNFSTIMWGEEDYLIDQ